MKSDLVDIACTLKHETPRGWLIFDGHRDVWIPKSQAELTEAHRPTGHMVITMPEWLAKEKELICLMISIYGGAEYPRLSPSRGPRFLLLVLRLDWPKGLLRVCGEH